MELQTDTGTRAIPNHATDPLVFLGHQLEIACHVYEALSNAEPQCSTPAIKNAFNDELQAAAERKELLEEGIARTRAATLEGVAVQLRVMAADLFDLRDCTFGEQAEHDRIASRAAGILLSILAVVEREAGVSREQFAGMWYLGHTIPDEIPTTH